jgi:hypothetical protein
MPNELTRLTGAQHEPASFNAWKPVIDSDPLLKRVGFVSAANYEIWGFFHRAPGSNDVADDFGGPGERPSEAALPDGYPSNFASNAVDSQYHTGRTSARKLA